MSRSEAASFPHTLRCETVPVSHDVLTNPELWRQPALASLLADAQANILKGHGREHSRNISFTFDPSRSATIRLALARIEPTSAIDLLEASERRRLDNIDADPVRLLYLSHNGYRALGVAEERIPADPTFRTGVADATGPEDLPVELSDSDFHQPVDAVLLIGDRSADQVAAVATPIMLALMAAGARLIAYENDAAPMPEEDAAHDPFVRASQCDAASIALAADPGGDGADSYGSYLVFRKHKRVAMQGECFFAPSLSFVRGLARREDRF